MSVLWAGQALTEAGWERAVRVAIGADGRIASVTPGAAAEGERLSILLPAVTNLHSHLFQRAMAGLAERRGAEGQDDFWSWRRLMYRFLDRLTPEDVQAIAALAQVEMLESGFAALAEFHYLHHGPDGTPYANPAEMAARIAAAAAETGIGLTLLPVLYEQGGCDGRPLGAGQRRFGSDPDEFARLLDGAGAAIAALPDAALGVAAHSLRAVSPAGLRAAVALAGQGPVHMHLAEQDAEVAEVRAAFNRRPVEWVLENAAPDRRWCLIHCTRMEPHETRALAATGAVAGLCPITEANLGDGIFDGVGFLAAGGRIGVGSDSNVRISLAGELRMLEYSQRLRDRGRAVLALPGGSTGRRLFDAARAGGAAAGRESGRIAPGARADLIALDAAAPALAGREGDALLDSWIFAGGDGLVREVWAAGRHVVRAGRHVARDALARRYGETMRRLAETL